MSQHDYPIEITKHVDLAAVANSLADRIRNAPLSLMVTCRLLPLLDPSHAPVWSITVTRRGKRSEPGAGSDLSTGNTIVEVADMLVRGSNVLLTMPRALSSGAYLSPVDQDLCVCIASIVRSELGNLSVLR